MDLFKFLLILTTNLHTYIQNTHVYTTSTRMKIKNPNWKENYMDKLKSEINQKIYTTTTENEKKEKERIKYKNANKIWKV